MSELFSGKKYSVIYADPPWKYSVYGKEGDRGAAATHYNVMNDDELEKLHVDDLAAEQSALFMWATAPCLPQALKLIKAWGFKYKTVAFTWIKQCKRSDKLFTGMGFYTRANAEFCLLATRGGGSPSEDFAGGAFRHYIARRGAQQKASGSARAHRQALRGRAAHRALCARARKRLGRLGE